DGNSHPHKFPYFRLSEMYMIKAEALIKQNNVAGGIAIINNLRRSHNVFNPPKDLATNLTQQQALDAVRDERLFEFAGEAKRRQDLIRLGGYLDARQFKTASAGYKVLMPIPITQIQNNPLLTQNAGY
ncbi:MAG TPA: RagB/SusD family nutrient uptake outer membrane protein, partial [Gemmatimonadaceae bacterium]|nr:RagB/SusD family nutrient uptake outer membrane protein [Gemmatimonadaceae bacterium]